jgi:hypothetical protein
MTRKNDVALRDFIKEIQRNLSQVWQIWSQESTFPRIKNQQKQEMERIHFLLLLWRNWAFHKGLSG